MELYEQTQLAAGPSVRLNYHSRKGAINLTLYKDRDTSSSTLTRVNLEHAKTVKFSEVTPTNSSKDVSLLVVQ